jgi:hypothetical protein
MLERSEPLFALLKGHAIVVLSVKNKRWRAYVSRVFQWRRFPILVEIIE